MHSKYDWQKSGLTFALPILSLWISSANADDTERAEILAVVDRIYAAIDSRDPVDWKPLITNDGKIVSFHQDPDGETGKQMKRVIRFGAMLESMTNDGGTVRER